MKKRYLVMMLIVVFVIFGMVTTTAQDDTTTQDTVRDGVAVTVYNQGSALIQDRRTIALETGLNEINFTDVASLIDPTSVNFTSVTDPQGTSVLEQNYVYDLVSTQALLERFVDEVIEVRVMGDGGESRTVSGVLLSANSGQIILQQDNGEVIILNNPQDIRFPALPEGLITRPTLQWLIQSVTGGDQQVELTYLTSGMSWSADYTILLNTDNTMLDLNGWVTLNNTSGTTYSDAQLKLIAGDVNRIQPEARNVMPMAMEMDMTGAMAPEPAVEQRELFEYQLYEITRPVTIADNETKQVEFVTGADIPATTYFVYNGSMSFYNYGYPLIDQYYGDSGITDVQTYLEFNTGEENGLGADLPAGRIRVYQEDVDGAALLIGENRIDHTPEGEMVDIFLGNAFDLVGERIQTDYRIISDNVLQETYEIRLRNRKDDEAVQIRVVENLFRWSNWEILSNSADYTQTNSNTIEFRVDVQPGEEVIITYTVQYSYPR